MKLSNGTLPPDMGAALALVDAPDALRAALPPLRRRLLERLREPASAVAVAGELGLPRQRVNYHLRTLEAAGFLELVEERPRRGCVERVLRTSARAFVVDPQVIAPAPAPGPASARRAAARRDRFAAETLVAAASGVVRDVSRMQARAAAQGARLLTCAMEADVRLASPADFARLSAMLATLVARAAAEVGAVDGGRSYRIVIGAHPTPAKTRRPRAAPATRPASPISCRTVQGRPAAARESAAANARRAR
jgi:DNA-binding transcriptional ArsR family regulator